MGLRTLDQIIIEAVTKADHPEIISATAMATPDRPANHNRVKVGFASGAEAYIMVRRVTGPGIPTHADYELPREAV
jgi:hypothetical protein